MNSFLSSDHDILAMGPNSWLIQGNIATSEQLNQFTYLAHALKKSAQFELQEWVLGYESLLLIFRHPVEKKVLLEALESLKIDSQTPFQSQHHTIPVQYNAPDLVDVARACRLTTQQVIELHHSTIYTVRFLGFAPGFAYLDGLDPQLILPRRAVPRPHMTPGAVAIGGQHAGIYPVASPGGWHWLGTTEYPLFQPNSPENPFTLQPGDTIQFTPIHA